MSSAATRSKSCDQNRQKNKFKMAAATILNSVYRS